MCLPRQSLQGKKVEVVNYMLAQNSDDIVNSAVQGPSPYFSRHHGFVVGNIRSYTTGVLSYCKGNDGIKNF